MLGDSLEYPFNSGESYRPYGMAILMTLTSILILPIFVLLGYYLKVVRTTLNGEDRIPGFDGLGDLFFDGLKMAAIVIVFLGTPFLVLLIENSGAANLVFSALFLAFIYMIPSAIIRLARKGSLLSSLNILVLASNSMSLDYLKGYITVLVALLMISTAQIILTLVLVVTIIGIFALPFILPLMRFYENLVIFRIIGKMADRD